MEINEAEYIFIKSLKTENLKAIEELLAANALSLTSWIGDKGVTPLHLAVGYGTEGFALCVTHSLLKHGSDPNAQSSCGKTSVHVAVAWGRVQNLQLLLLHGGDPWIQDDERKNAFNYAFEMEAWDVVKLLRDFLLTAPKRHLTISPVRNHEYPPRNLDNLKNIEEKKEYFVTTNILINNVREIHLEGEINESDHSEAFCNQEISLSFGSQDTSINENISDWTHEIAENNNKTYTVDSPCPASVKTEDLFNELITAVQKRELRISDIATLNTSNEIPRKNQDIETADGSENFCSNLSPHVFSHNESSVPKRESRISGIYTLNSSNETPVKHEEIMDNSEETGDFSSFSPRTSPNQNLFTELILAAKKRELRISKLHEKEIKTEDVSEEAATFLSFSHDNSSHYESCETLEVATNWKVHDEFNELRDKLAALGMNPGPITESTKAVYQRQLERLVKQGFTSPPPKLPHGLHSQSNGEPASLNFSPELISAVNNPISTDYTDLENILCSYFSKPEFKGSPKTCFNYLLLDSRKTLNLPRRAASLSPKETLRQFLAAIFYVGKGQAGRPYAHLRLAKHAYDTRQEPDHPKEKAIVDAWRAGHGIICFQVFHNIISDEALTREAAIIHALGRQHLHNQRKGDYHGCVGLWDPVQQRMLGVHLLLKAKELYLRDEERPLFPNDF